VPEPFSPRLNSSLETEKRDPPAYRPHSSYRFLLPCCITIVLVDITKELVLVNADGSVEVAGRATRDKLSQRAGRFRLVNGPNSLIILRRLQAEEDSGDARVLMAGEIISKSTILDVINMVINSQWRGELHVYGLDSYRRLSLDRAALRYASTDVPAERLGEFLVSRNLVSQEQLTASLLNVNPDKRLGQALVEQGFMTPEGLFKALGVQVEEIFYSALMVREGAYLFELPSEDAEPPAMTLHLPVQALLLEGVQRIDEMALFRERIPDSNICPVAVESGLKPDLDHNLKMVFSIIDGKRTVSDLARTLRWDEFRTTKAVYHLLQLGYIILRVSAKLDRAAVVALVERFNDVIREIFEVVSRHGSSAGTRERLTAWVEGSGYASYFGGDISEKGAIDPERVIAALDRFGIERPVDALDQALHELAAFALFAATPELPRSAELALAKYVNQRLKQSSI
jgi:hypothetical protein